MQEELTANMELPPIALKLHTLRLKKNLSMEIVSKICKVSIEDLLKWEMGKIEPSKEILERLVNFYS